MEQIINAQELRGALQQVVEGVRQGHRYTVLYRSRPAFRIIPIEEADRVLGPISDDPLYQAEAVGESADGRAAADHDLLLYSSTEK